MSCCSLFSSSYTSSSLSQLRPLSKHSIRTVPQPATLGYSTYKIFRPRGRNTDALALLRHVEEMRAYACFVRASAGGNGRARFLHASQA